MFENQDTSYKSYSFRFHFFLEKISPCQSILYITSIDLQKNRFFLSILQQQYTNKQSHTDWNVSQWFFCWCCRCLPFPFLSVFLSCNVTHFEIFFYFAISMNSNMSWKTIYFSIKTIKKSIKCAKFVFKLEYIDMLYYMDRCRTIAIHAPH